MSNCDWFWRIQKEETLLVLGSSGFIMKVLIFIWDIKWRRRKLIWSIFIFTPSAGSRPDLWCLYCEGTKKNQNFFKIFQRLFIVKRFFFYNILYGLKFFVVIYLGSSAYNSNFYAFSALRLKRGLNRPIWLQNLQFHHVKVSFKPWHYRYRCHIFGTFFAPKAFFWSYNSK